MQLVGGSAFAQGCDQDIQDYTVTCDTAPGGVVHATRCSGVFGSGGGPCYFCSLGSGVCVQKNGTHVQYTLANEGYDDTCSTCTGCCLTGCDDPTHFACLDDCQCHLISPILVDTTGKGFHFTSAGSGVLFDMAADGHPIKMAWTAANSGNAFLALDRNHNGKIDSGKELSVTSQLNLNPTIPTDS